MGELTDLVAGYVLAADDRTKMAKGRYDDLDSLTLGRIVDSTNAADLRWRLGQQVSQFLLNFHFGDNQDVARAWGRARDGLQAYADCADSIYRKYQFEGTAPPGACLAARDSATLLVEDLNKELLRGYRKLEGIWFE
jgi:hypothetical protein